MVVITEHKQPFDNHNHATKAPDAATGAKKLVTIPGIRHYGIYREARGRAQDFAVN